MGTPDDVRDELTRAELAGAITELDALRLHAMLAIAEGSPFATDYLEMAEAAASSPHEMAIVAELVSGYELQHGDAFAAATRCLSTLEHVGQTERLWIHLLLALDQLGALSTIDAALRGFMRLDEPCAAQLVRSLSSEPALAGIRTRPAFRHLLERLATE